MPRFHSNLESIDALNKKVVHFQQNLQFVMSQLQVMNLDVSHQQSIGMSLNQSVAELEKIKQFYNQEYARAGSGERRDVLKAYQQIANAIAAFEQNPYAGIDNLERVKQANSNYLNGKVEHTQQLGFCDILSSIFWASCAMACFFAAVSAAVTIPLNPFWGTASTLAFATGFLLCMSLAVGKAEEDNQYQDEHESANNLEGSLIHAFDDGRVKNLVRTNANSAFVAANSYPPKSEGVNQVPQTTLYPPL